MNEITLIGQVPKAPTYHCTEEARDLLRFALQTSRGGAKPSSTRGGADLHHCQIWGSAAIDLHKHLRPGDRLLIRGELRYRTHRNRSGSLQRLSEIHVKSYTYLGGTVATAAGRTRRAAKTAV